MHALAMSIEEGEAIGSVDALNKEGETIGSVDAVNIGSVDAIEAIQPELTIICGVPTEMKGSIEMEKVERMIAGRSKLPLSLLLRNRGMHSRASSETFISVVCYGTFDDTGMKVSDLIFTGTTEARIFLSDPSDIPGGISFGSLRGSCLLVMNPVHVGTDSLRIPSLRSCVRIGRLSALATCEECPKPVLSSRDGSLCYKHAAGRCSLRTSIGGSMINIVEEVKEVAKRVVVPLSAEEQQQRSEDHRRQSLLAKKRTALLLHNRRNSLDAGRDVTFERRFAAEGVMELEEDRVKEGDVDALEKFQNFKRKRELLETRGVNSNR